MVAKMASRILVPVRERITQQRSHLGFQLGGDRLCEPLLRWHTARKDPGRRRLGAVLPRRCGCKMLRDGLARRRMEFAWAALCDRSRPVVVCRADTYCSVQACMQDLLMPLSITAQCRRQGARSLVTRCQASAAERSMDRACRRCRHNDRVLPEPREGQRFATPTQ